MPRFTKGGLTVETAIAREAAELRRDGFTEQRAKTAAVREADSAKAAEPAKTVAPAADTAATPKSTK